MENFAVSIQSGIWITILSSVFGSFLLLLVVVCLDQSLLIKIISLSLWNLSNAVDPLDTLWYMASSMLLALNTDWNSCQYHKEVNDPKQSFEWNKLLTATIQVCIEADVDSNVASNCPYELTKFGSFLRLNIHYFDITEGNWQSWRASWERSFEGQQLYE